MTVNIILNPIFALMLFMTGIWMGSMIDPLFGLITILGKVYDKNYYFG